MKKLVAIAGLAALLSACGGDADELDAPTEATAPELSDEAPAAESDAEPEGDTDGDTADAADASEAPAKTAAAANTIPAKYHGVWDAVSADCKEVSDGRLSVRAKEMQFWESTGTVTKVVENADGSVTVSLALSGEGEQWTSTENLSLKQGNLVITDDEFGPFERKRCT